MAETSQVAYANHEYAISRGDRFLGLIKAVVRDAEKRHDSLALLARFAKWIPGHGPVSDPSLNRVITFGDRSNSLYLSSPFILAAGANKTGNQIPEFAHLGFGGLCVGTATRQARPGNQHHPRTELIPEDRAIQNSMGLNNPGVDSVAKAVDQSLGKAHRNGMCVGLSVAETPGVEEEEQQVEDVLDSFRKAYRVADWVEVNVSCPNTGHGRGDADTTHVEHVFQAIMRQRRSQPLRKAVYAKLSPDMGERQLLATLEVLRDLEVSGVVLFNTFPSERCKFLGMKTPMENMRTLTDQGVRVASVVAPCTSIRSVLSSSSSRNTRVFR